MPSIFDDFNGTVIDDTIWNDVVSSDSDFTGTGFFLEDAGYLVSSASINIPLGDDAWDAYHYCHLGKLATGLITIDFDVDPVNYLANGGHSHFLRVREYTVLDPRAPVSKYVDFGIDIGGGFVGSWINDSEVHHTELNMFYYATTIALRMVVDTATGNVTLYANVDGAGYTQVRSANGVFPVDSQIEIFFISRILTSRASTNSYVHWLSFNIDAANIVDIPTTALMSFEPMDAYLFEEEVVFDPLIGKPFPLYWYDSGAPGSPNRYTYPTPTSSGLHFSDEGMFFSSWTFTERFELIVRMKRTFISGGYYGYGLLFFQVGGDEFGLNVGRVSEWWVQWEKNIIDGNSATGPYTYTGVTDPVIDIELRVVINGLSIDCYYRLFGNTTWLPAGSTTATKDIRKWMLGIGRSPLYPEPDVDAYFTEFFVPIGEGGSASKDCSGQVSLSYQSPIHAGIGRVIQPDWGVVRTFFHCTGLTGGTENDLDGLDPTGVYGTILQLSQGCVALVVEPDDTIGLYICYEEAGAVHNPPDIIVPATNPGDFFWKKIRSRQFMPAKRHSYASLSAGPYTFDYANYGDANQYWFGFMGAHGGAAGDSIYDLHIYSTGVYLGTPLDEPMTIISVPNVLFRKEVPSS